MGKCELRTPLKFIHYTGKNPEQVIKFMARHDPYNKYGNTFWCARKKNPYLYMVFGHKTIKADTYIVALPLLQVQFMVPSVFNRRFKVVD